MIIGIGTDLIEISRIKKSVERFGKRFLNKIFTEKEIEYCYKFKNYFERLSGKVSAKEAYMKAISTGITQGVWFKDIEILNCPNGKPEVVLHGNTLKINRQLQISNIFLSITHTENYASSTVILEK